MKPLKTSLIAIVAVTLVTTSSFAQTTKQETPLNETQSSPQTKENPNNDFDAQMAKFHESYGKLQSKAEKAKDPQMKADINAMLSKMKKVDDEYNAMKSNTKLSKEQIAQSQKQMRAEMQETRKMHDDMKAKYGVGKEQEDKKQGKMQQNQESQPDEAPAPK
jgi:hypothetical protein